MYGRCSHWPDIHFSKLVTQDFNWIFMFGRSRTMSQILNGLRYMILVWVFAWLQEVYNQRVSLGRAQI
jgi:hypothetical protein